MTITPSLAFDVCHEVYRAIRGDLEGIAILDPTKPASDHVWRPDSGPRASEYMADFSLCCKRALEGPELGSRMILCNLFIIGQNDWKRTYHFLGLREDVAANWLDEIRERVGKQCMQRGLFPVRQYFGERSRARRNAQRSAPQSAARALRPR